MCIYGGVIVTSLGEIFLPGAEVNLGAVSIPFTIFATVALINAVNMSDGLDGLAGTQALIPLAGLALLAGLHGDAEHLLPLVALCGCIIGFLYFNCRSPWRRSASVFLGDAGSNLLGFALAWFLIDMSQGEGALVKPVAVLWFALLIIYSTVEIVSRRVLRRRSPFKPDREHLHHAFILAGFSVTETVLALAGVTLIGVIIGISSSIFDVPDFILFGAFVLFGIMFLRVIFRSWRAMQFLYRSICRRREQRRRDAPSDWEGAERRYLSERRKAANE
jgi:UDP-GlcNAc:undecaprenyl-phosphate GlcNAc-1-phosphate transferase